MVLGGEVRDVWSIKPARLTPSWGWRRSWSLAERRWSLAERSWSLAERSFPQREPIANGQSGGERAAGASRGREHPRRLLQRAERSTKANCLSEIQLLPSRRAA